MGLTDFLAIIFLILVAFFILFFAIKFGVYSLMIEYLKKLTLVVGKLLRFDKIVEIASRIFEEMTQTFKEV